MNAFIKRFTRNNNGTTLRSKGHVIKVTRASDDLPGNVLQHFWFWKNADTYYPWIVASMLCGYLFGQEPSLRTCSGLSISIRMEIPSRTSQRTGLTPLPQMVSVYILELVPHRSGAITRRYGEGTMSGGDVRA